MVTAVEKKALLNNSHTSSASSSSSSSNVHPFLFGSSSSASFSRVSAFLSLRQFSILDTSAVY